MENNTDMDVLLSPSQLANRVGVSVGTIRALMKERRLEHLYISPKVRKVTLRSWQEFRRKNTLGECK